jgi:hypothetical protein
MILLLLLLFQGHPIKKPVNLCDSIIKYQMKYNALIKQMDSINRKQTLLIKKYKK